jgi:membrane-associated protease RseP (regulator of RpoE activity)
MQEMDNSPSPNEDYDPEIIRAEIVDEMEPGAPWEWQEVRPVPRRRRVRLPLLLFIATCLTTLVAGVQMSIPSGTGWLDALLNGLWYAVPVMTILLCHEMGHFIQAHRYGVYASLPYFIPMPIPDSPLGTLGAVIAMEPRMGHRKALFDIGITGPLAGLVPTFIFLIVGLHYSTIARVPQHYPYSFGEPLLFRILASWILEPVPPGHDIFLDPMAFAGWVGLLITSLNLIPIGQLDGGHVLYALLRQKANRVASFLLLMAIVLVVLDFRHLGAWTLMLILLLVMGPVHPPTADDEEPLGIGRTVLGWLTLGFIILGFTPTPLKFMP